MNLPEKKKPRATSRAIELRNSLIDHLAAKGLQLGQIAEKVGLSTSTVGKYLKTPESVARVEQVHQEYCSMIATDAAALGEAFDEWAPEAASRLKSLIRGETDDVANPVPHAVALNAAKEVLDRAPNAPGRRDVNVDARSIVINLPEKQFQNAQQALADVGEVIDVEGEKDG